MATPIEIRTSRDGPVSKTAQFVSKFSTCSALVIDSRSESCAHTVHLLQRMGMGEVVRAARPRSGRAFLEARHFDFLFCDYDFDDTVINGQDFVDELRIDRVLPYSTVVFFVTSEAGRAKVSNAAESGLDQYLLKPFTEASFTRRVEGSRMRKLALRQIFDAMSREDFEATVELCEQEIESETRYWLVAAQIGAEACVRTQRLDRAQQLYNRILAENAVPWARLGVARVEAQRGDYEQAQLILRSLISDHPFYVDAYDVLGRCQMERGEFEEALGTFATASRLTPTCVRRLQKLAHVAFINDDTSTAARALGRAVQLGRETRLLDLQSVLLLCFSQFDETAWVALQRSCELLRAAAARDPGNHRVARFVEIADTLVLLGDGRDGDAMQACDRLSKRLHDPDFDFEAAGNFFCLLDRFDRRELRMIEQRAWARTAALRFCVSRVAVQLLRNCAKVASYREIIDQAAAEISNFARSEVARLLAGERLGALQALIAEGERTYNARLLEIAQKIAERHDLPELKLLRARITALRQDYCSTGTQAALQFRVNQPVSNPAGEPSDAAPAA